MKNRLAEYNIKGEYPVNLSEHAYYNFIGATIVGLGNIESVTCDYCMRYLLQLLQYCLQKLKHNHIVWKVCNVSMSVCFHWELVYKHNLFADKFTNWHD